MGHGPLVEEQDDKKEENRNPSLFLTGEKQGSLEKKDEKSGKTKSVQGEEMWQVDPVK